MTHWKRPWCWERLKVGEEGDDRGWDGRVASLTQWTCVWVDSGSCWWTGRAGVLQFMGLQRVRHDWASELSWTEIVYDYIIDIFTIFFIIFFICSGFCHTLKWNSHGFTCVPHPDPPSHLPLHPLPLGLPGAPGLSTCLMHPTWAGDLFNPR